MKTILTIIFLTLILGASTIPTSFITEQKKYERVRTAFTEKEKGIEQKLKETGIETGNLNIMIVVYKDSDELELYARKKTETSYKKLITYKICSRSGVLGPKRKQGDGQVPEGFYTINQFNPLSNFYLSLGVSYPNQSDRRKSNASDLGGSIFIHGNCVTIGCLPMTDDKIKEIYVYAVHAKNNGQTNIPVYIFPFRMTEENFSSYESKYKSNKELISFWKNLKTGYTQFAKDKSDLKVKVEANGDYKF